MKIHFIGIGGIGVSALAQYFLSKGNTVSGSDLVASEITEMLAQKGAKIFQGNLAENISDGVELVIHSPAVKADNPEYKKAKDSRIKTQSYPEALGKLTEEYFTIAVSGAHGKSTTTSMLGLALAEAGLDPTVIVGTKVREFGNSNFRAGKSKHLVIEACEYDSSFLNYFPKIIVVTNIDKEHLDYFKNFTNVKKAFKDFIKKLSADGFLVYNKDDKNLTVIARSVATKQSCSYSLKQNEAKKLAKILKVPGKHNVLNALAVLEVSKILGIPKKTALKALSKFTGTWRRFEERELKIKNLKLKIISDYAHHPNEISATLKAAREKFPKKKIWVVFQPHQHQRTHYLFNDFVKTFRAAKIDNIIITDIYDVAGREEKNISAKISSENLVKKIAKKNVQYMPMEEIESYIKESIKSGDVLLVMGAGDIYKLADKF